MAKHIFFAHISDDPRQLVRLVGKEREAVRYIFLAQDYAQHLRWEEQMSSRFERVVIKDDLDGAVAELKKPFLDLMVALGKKYDSDAWWISRVSEMNTLVSHLFLYCCYLKVFADRLSGINGAVCVIAEDRALLESAADIARKNDFKISWVSRKSSLVLSSLAWIAGGVRVVRALRRWILAYSAGTGFDPRRQEKKKKILIHTYIDEGCFSGKGEFHDRYFPGLADWLIKQGFGVVIVPVLFNLRGGYARAWERLRRSQYACVNPYKYYHLSDYFYAFCRSFEQRRMPDGEIFFGEMNVSRLFHAERDRSLFDTIDSLLYIRLPRRLVGQGMVFQYFITPFENMVDEKSFVLGFRRYAPDTKTAGFQHSTIYPNLLCQVSITEDQRGVLLPDRIVCNGEFFKNIMVEAGIPSSRCVVGPALRYAHLHGVDQIEERGKKPEAGILIPLSLQTSDAIELVSKAIKAFGDLAYLKVRLKLHPMMSQEVILKACGGKKLPSHFEFVDGKIFDWLARVQVVVAMSSSVILEVLAVGMPVVVVGSDNALDFNPLGSYPEMAKVFIDPLEIRAETLRLLSLSDEEKLKYQQDSVWIKKMCFNPVDSNSMQAFIDN